MLHHITLAATVCIAAAVAGSASADTLAHWRFEAGPADTDVQHTAPGGYPNFSADVPDSSGSGNALSIWGTGGGAGFAYKTDVPAATLGDGTPNNFSIKNTGGGPASFTEPSSALTSVEPSQWTIEASFKLEDGGHRTIVGRDARNIVTTGGSPDLAALYLQVRPGDRMAIAYADVSGYFHEAESAEGAVDRFNFGTDPDGLAVSWYNVAAVNDGSTLSLYLDNVDAGSGYQLVASVDLTASGSPNTALSNGSGSTDVGGDWAPGDWTVGRGLYNGGHADRGNGFIDEVRISDAALETSDLLFFSEANTFSLIVNSTDGSVVLKNTSSESVTFDYYEITSENSPGALNEAGWDSLESQGVGGAAAGDFNGDGDVDSVDYAVWREGLGTIYDQTDFDEWLANYGASGSSGGWLEAGGSDANILSELFTGVDGTTLAPDEELDLGTAFNPAVFGAGNDGDLQFRFSQGDETLRVGSVTYVTGASPTAAPEPAAALMALLAGAAVVGVRKGRKHRAL